MKRYDDLKISFFVLLVILVFGLALWSMGYSAGTLANFHIGSDTDHMTHNVNTDAYSARIDSGISWGTSADSNRIAATWYTPWKYLGNEYFGFMYVFRLTRIDTTLTLDDNDTVSISVQTTTDPTSWYPNINTIHDFDPVNDTATIYKYFPHDSALVQIQTNYVRTSITYTAWQDSADLGSICDTLSHVPMLYEETVIPVK